MDWIDAHRKAILAAIGAVLILVLDENTTQEIVAIVDTILLFVVPNDQGAIDRIYHRR